jgi:drug/metabolite transporter (DMT)-like permease
VFGATLARLFPGEPLHSHTVFAMMAATVGLACMSPNKVIVRHRRDAGMQPALALAGVISTLIALPFAHPSTLEAAQFPRLRVLGPGQLATGLLLYMVSLERIPAAPAALLEFVLGPIWVWIAYGERPADLTPLSGVIVIGSAAANVWLDSRRPSG